MSLQNDMKLALPLTQQTVFDKIRIYSAIEPVGER